jgi:hypothetical protein
MEKVELVTLAKLAEIGIGLSIKRRSWTASRFTMLPGAGNGTRQSWIRPVGFIISRNALLSAS